jgi:16S rRNA (cytosine1402-N4)-methyltransferase
MTYQHVSAMLNETLACLACRSGGIYVDGTLGGAGHARAICEQIMPNGLLIGIDQDREAIANAERVLAPHAASIHLFHGNFIHLPDYLAQLKIDAVDGILLDLGLSQYQLESSGRGFSFQKDEPLDMRMDIRANTTAQDLINHLKEEQLVRIFQDYGEERWARRIARAVIAGRRKGPIRTSRQLADLVRAVVPARAAAQQKIHPATRVFMALRIAVNQELERLVGFLDFAVDLLKPGGRLVVLSFHSLEDRLVKQRFKYLAKGCTCPPDLPQCICSGRPAVHLITKKVMRPTAQEVNQNPMARSTRLRAVEKLPPLKA